MAVSTKDNSTGLYVLNLTIDLCKEYEASARLELLQSLPGNASIMGKFAFGRSTWLLMAWFDHFELFRCDFVNFPICVSSKTYQLSINSYSYLQFSGMSYIFLGKSTSFQFLQFRIAGNLSGTTQQMLVNGSASFSDLVIDHIGSNYYLGFFLSSGLSKQPLNEHVTYSQNISVQKGKVSYLRFSEPCADCCQKTDFSVNVLESGKNVDLSDNNRTIYAAFSDGNKMHFVESFRHPSLGARCIKYFEIAEFGKFIAVGNFFNGTRFNLFSTVFRLNIPDANQKQIPTGELYARYTAASWNYSTSVWHDLSGNKRDSSPANGVINITMSSGGYSARADVAWLAGSTADAIQLTILPLEFTICSVSRYSGPKNQNRILVGLDTYSQDEFYHGHDAGGFGADYGTLLGNFSSTKYKSSTDWIVMCGQNSGDKIMAIDGIQIQTTQINRTEFNFSKVMLGINLVSNHTSDFAIMEIAVWSRPLSWEEIQNVSIYYLNSLGIFNSNSSFQSSPLQVQQEIWTRGAYYFESFSMNSGSGLDTPFLIVANHFDDITGYSTASEILKWNNISQRFIHWQYIPTTGATSIAVFQINNQWYAAISNFFDGVSHEVDSLIYRWSTVSSQFEFFQRLHTIGAHHIAYFNHRSLHYLAVSQYGTDSLESSISSYSLLYRLNIESGYFEIFMKLNTKGAMQIEPFRIGTNLFLAVANSADPYDGDTTVLSKLFVFKCLGGEDLAVEFYQDFETHRATQWKHFRRAGLDHLAVVNWIPEKESNSSISVFTWNGCSFYQTALIQSTQAYNFDHAAISGRHYLFQASPSVSEVVVSGAGPMSSPLLEQAQTSDGSAYFYVPGWLAGWNVDITSTGLLNIGGSVGCNIQFCNQSSPL